MSQQVTLRGAQLCALVSATVLPIKLYLQGEHRPSRKIGREEALRLVQDGLYIGGGTNKRVRYIRECDPRKIVWATSWRNSGGAAMLDAGEWWEAQQTARRAGRVRS